MLGTMLTTGGLGAPGRRRLAARARAPPRHPPRARVRRPRGRGFMDRRCRAVPRLLRRPRRRRAVLRRRRRGRRRPRRRPSSASSCGRRSSASSPRSWCTASRRSRSRAAGSAAPDGAPGGRPRGSAGRRRERTTGQWPPAPPDPADLAEARPARAAPRSWDDAALGSFGRAAPAGEPAASCVRQVSRKTVPSTTTTTSPPTRTRSPSISVRRREPRPISTPCVISSRSAPVRRAM